MIRYNTGIVNVFPPNLYEAESFPWESGVITIVRTSPQQHGPQREGEYQQLGMQEVIRERGLFIAEQFQAIGVDGRFVYDQLADAIALAERIGVPILAHDWERLSHYPHKLKDYPVSFVTVLPLVPSHELMGLRKRAFNRLFPSRKGGRPRANIDIAAIREWERLGMSYRDIAKLTGVPKSTLKDLIQNCPKTP
jgi:hypothetical protein